MSSFGVARIADEPYWRKLQSNEMPAFGDFPDEFEGSVRGGKSRVWIDWFYVPEDLRKLGLGRALYRAFEEWLIDGDENADIKVRLMAADCGDGPSDEFWLKMGFEYMLQDADDYEQRQMMVKMVRGKARQEAPVTV